MTTTPDLPIDLDEARQHAGTYDESLRLARRFLPLVLLLLAIASASLAVGVVLESGVWTNEEIIHGPFRTEINPRDAWIPVGQPYSNFSCCVGARPDDLEHPAASRLRAWLNGRELGPAHALHADIRRGQTAAFSHWDDDTIRFSIPNSVANDQTAVLRVRYPVQYSIEFLSLNELIVVTFAVLAGFCGLAARMLPLLHTGVRGGIAVSAAILPVYVAFLITGYATRQPVPATYIFHYLPIDALLNGFEPYLPAVVIVFAIFLAGLNWTSGLEPGLEGVARQQELQTVNFWGRFGFLATAGILYVLIAASAWSGHVASQDYLETNIGGFVPESDAAGYYSGGLNYLIFNQIDPFNMRRPLAALFRSETIALGGLNYVGTILVQVAALSLALHWAVNAIMRWRGLAAGLVFWATAFILFRPFMITTMTEPLALFCSFCSIPFFIHGLQQESVPHLLAGAAFLFVALFIRMGAMFVMPFMALWAILYLGRNVRQRFRNACAVSAVLLIVMLGNVAVVKMYGERDAALGGNFSSTLCGMSIGSYWTDCYSRYARELNGLTEVQKSSFFYRTTFRNLLHDPRTFLRSGRSALTKFREDIISLPTTGYRWPGSSRLLLFAIYLVSMSGWIYALRKNTGARAASFAFFVGLGIVASVPFVYQSDPRRMLYATDPLLLLAIAGGFIAPGALRLRNDSLKWQTGAIPLAAAAILALLLPFGLRLVGIGKPGREVLPQYTENDRLIAGRRLQTGFIVLPDQAQPAPDVPSMTIGKFREFLGGTRQVPPDAIQKLPAPPFAFILPFEWSKFLGDRYFVPPDVFEDRSVQRWKLVVTEWNPAFGWFVAQSAMPMK